MPGIHPIALPNGASAIDFRMKNRSRSRRRGVGGGNGNGKAWRGTSI
jgi:hypothetical protein